MHIFNYSIKNITDVALELGVDLQTGLDKKSVAERVSKFGLNKLAIKETNGWHIFFRQFKSAFIYLLLAAMIITIFLGEMIDALMIFVFIAINTGLGFYQEYSSEKTAQLLNQYSLPRAKVLRMGKVEQVTSDQLVPGDIVILATGDKVPADIRLIEQDNLTIDETILTGESVPVFKKTDNLTSEPSSYHEAFNLVFSGTDVLKGEARGLVVATGKNTVFGQIAKLAGESRKVSDFEKGISRFSRFILKLVGVTLFVVFVAHLLINRNGAGLDIFKLIIFSVALTVSVIPEALPLVTTFSLARSAKRLAKRKVIVKRLSAIEDLGGIEILCCDKTGTLTENKLTITNIYSGNNEQTIWFANLASSFELKKKIEPFDIALDKGLNSEQKKKITKAVKISEESFDPKTRKNSVLVKDGNKTFLIIRGEIDAVVSSCSALDKKAKDNIDDWTSREGRQGHRILTIIYKEFNAIEKNSEFYIKELEKNDFTFSGIISFVDPIKKSSFSAVEQAKSLGVKIIIITGDSPEVAGAVANEIGLIDSSDRVITGEKWQTASQKKQKEYLEIYSVFARVSPEEKFTIIEALRKRYMIGFLGEGINDAPALKIAGVSLVVDSAADIARESSDIILLKKNLEVIIEGIKEGRQVFANTTKYIKSTLASNFGNFFAIAITSLMVDFLPMLPIQILLLNLLSDVPMISISTDNVEASELKLPKKYQTKDIIIIAIILGLVSMVFDFIFFGLFYRISPEVLQTNWFIGSILTELVLFFSIRTKSLFIKSLRPSKSIILLSLMTFILTIGLPFTSFGQKVFKFVAPTLSHLMLILSLVIIYFFISEVVKLLYYKNKVKE
jgi:Mg2+-importing ATPase